MFNPWKNYLENQELPTNWRNTFADSGSEKQRNLLKVMACISTQIYKI